MKEVSAGAVGGNLCAGCGHVWIAPETRHCEERAEWHSRPLHHVFLKMCFDKYKVHSQRLHNRHKQHYELFTYQTI